MTSVVKEEQQCFQIQTLECSNEEVEMKTEVCSYVYESKETPQKVKVIEVEFEKKCTVNMVTVCQPQGNPYKLEHIHLPKNEAPSPQNVM